MKYETRIDKIGTKRYYLNDILHREDGPAIEYANGEKHWYKNGKLHRDDGPAIKYVDEKKCWYQNGKLHREAGPAVENYLEQKIQQKHLKKLLNTLLYLINLGGMQKTKDCQRRCLNVALKDYPRLYKKL